MKTIRLAALFLFCPIIFYGQTLTGLWIGTVNNDSNTIRKDQSFEIVLTHYKDKVYGFSRSTFVVNDTLFYIVKRVKGTIEGDVCEVKDDEIVSYNFKGRLDKGVKMVSTFRFDRQDSVWRMDGDWKTNKTKKYYSLSGKIALAQEKDLDKSKIFPHLEELKLAEDVAFYKESKKPSEPVVAVKQPVKEVEKPALKDKKWIGAPVNAPTTEVAIQNQQSEKRSVPVERTTDVNEKAIAVQSKPQVNTQIPVIDKAEKNVPTVNKDAKTESPVQIQPIINAPTKEQAIAEVKKSVPPARKDTAVIVQAKSNASTQINHPTNAINKPAVVKEEKPTVTKSEPIVISKPVEQKKQPVVETVKPEEKPKETAPVTVLAQKPETQKPVSLFADVKPANVASAAVFVAERKIAAPQVVNYKSDSLELVLYDNGEVDGDTVSVLLNGEIILAKQGLRASAIKKTIHIPAGKDDDMTLVLYAENLGKYPPNTGLLIVHDGDDTYQIRFSADLQQNAAVIFKRKKN